MFFGESRRRGYRLRALAGICLAAGLAAVSVSTYALAGAQQDYANFTVAPPSVTSGQDTEFILTVTALETFKGGIVIVQVPDGWSLPTTTGSEDSLGYTSLVPPVIGKPDLSTSSTTITVTDIALAPNQVLTISYWAEAAEPAPPPSETVNFGITTQQFAISPTQSLSQQVNVNSPVLQQIESVSASPSSASASSSTSASASSSPSPTLTSSPPSSGGSSSHLSVALLVGLAAAVGLVGLLVMWLVRRRPLPVPEQHVRATPHPGPHAQVSVRTMGPEPTLTVRIEPHPDASTTTIEEVPP
jgi:hypothetical protein